MKISKVTKLIAYTLLLMASLSASAALRTMLSSYPLTGELKLRKSVFLREKDLPIYILLSNLTDEGWKTIRGKPERIKEVNRELENFGVKVLHQYATLGPHDFVNIVDAPDNKTIAKLSIELGSRGTIQIVSMPAIPIDEFITSIKK
jgi:uncharacterized protein with GYD domain